LKAIGKLNVLKGRVMDIARRLTEALNIISVDKRESLLAKLEECLMITCVNKPL